MACEGVPFAGEGVPDLHVKVLRVPPWEIKLEAIKYI